MPRKVSPRRVKRKTSPRRVKRKTSPRRVKRKTSTKRKTSPRRKARKTSPRRKARKTSPRRRMNIVHGEKEIARQLAEDTRRVNEVNRLARERSERSERSGGKGDRYRELKRALSRNPLSQRDADYIIRKVMEGSFHECMIDTVARLMELGYEYKNMIGIIKSRGCLTNVKFQFLGLLLKRLKPSYAEKNKILMVMYERNPHSIISDYENDKITESKALELLEDYIKEGL